MSVINDPVEAREYIKKFSQRLGREIEYVETATRRIGFATMSDEDAVFVANELQNMGIEAAKKYKGYYQ